MTIRDDLQKLVGAWKKLHPDIRFLLTTEHGIITIHLIEIPLNKRRRGYGSEMLAELCCIADRHDMAIVCVPDSSRGTSKDALEQFYRLHGFEWQDSQMVRQALYSDLFASPA
jgi:hypothetical protein